MIPRLLHFVWLGTAPLPPAYARYRESWQENHPEWRVKVWRDDDLPTLRNQAIFDAATTLAQKADIARYEIVLREGGVYVDADVECLKPLTPLIAGVHAFAAWEDQEFVCNAIFGATSGHPLLRETVARIPMSIASRPNAGVVDQTGPRLLTEVATELSYDGTPISLFPPEVFYPYHYTEYHRRHEYFPRSYAVHHWSGSWGGIRRRLVIAIDWETPALALAVVAAFRSLFPTVKPVQLALASPATSPEELWERARAIVEPVAGNLLTNGDMWLCTFDDLVEAEHDLAVVPTGDGVADSRQLAAAIEYFIALRASLEGVTPSGPALYPPGGGDTGELIKRLGKMPSAPDR